MGAYEIHNFFIPCNQCMLLVNGVSGNIYTNKSDAKKYAQPKKNGAAERLLVSRAEMARLRLRRKTDRGTDIGLVLEPGSRLHHGDILDVKEKFIVVDQMPEKVASVVIGKRNTQEMIDAAALVGHTIGNRHRPIAIHQGKISFPIQNDSEIEVFEKLMHPGVRLDFSVQVFQSSGEVHHHE
jgi:urease accessory protein